MAAFPNLPVLGTEPELRAAVPITCGLCGRELDRWYLGLRFPACAACRGKQGPIRRETAAWLAARSDAPIVVDTPAGPAEVSVERIRRDIELWPLVTGQHPAIHGDLIIARSRLIYGGAPDVCAAFTRERLTGHSQPHGRWKQVTGEFPARDADRWRDHETRYSFPGQPMADWLTRVTEGPDLR